MRSDSWNSLEQRAACTGMFVREGDKSRTYQRRSFRHTKIGTLHSATHQRVTYTDSYVHTRLTRNLYATSHSSIRSRREISPNRESAPFAAFVDFQRRWLSLSSSLLPGFLLLDLPLIARGRQMFWCLIQPCFESGDHLRRPSCFKALRRLRLGQPPYAGPQ